MDDDIFGIALVISIVVVVGALLTTMLFGCSSQPPPVVVQAAPTPAPTPKPLIPPDPLTSLRPDVRNAIVHNTHETLHDGITTIFEYTPDEQWQVDCAPMHTVTIRLAPDEVTDNDSVILGDPTRWSKKVSTQAVMIEPAGDFGGYIDTQSQQRIPADPHMISTLSITTSQRRNYNFLLRMKPRANMGALEFYYPDTVKQQQEARAAALKEQQ